MGDRVRFITSPLQAMLASTLSVTTLLLMLVPTVMSSAVQAQSIPVSPPLDSDEIEVEASDIEDLEIDDLELDAESLESEDLNVEDLGLDDLELDHSDLEDLEIDLGIDDLDPENLGIDGPEDNATPPSLPNSGRSDGKRDQFEGSIFEDVVLTPNQMVNPTTVRGISGGPLTASQVAGRTDTATGICTGFVDTEPDHRIELTEFFAYLSLQVESSEDTVLVVRGPGGSWCNDDVMGFNPGLTGEWLSGIYDIWVGSYNEQTYHPYVIRFSEQQ